MPHKPQFSTSEIEFQLDGRFSIIDTIRSGAQGHVYRAMRTRTPGGTPTNDLVALKLYFDPAHVERVEREVSAMDRLRVPCLANLVEHGSIFISGTALRYVASEFIVGSPLDECLLKAGPLSPATVAIVGRDISTAISTLWEHRIVHRDVNPKNIMLRDDQKEAVLIDLGIARYLSQAALTSIGTAWGTHGYMSPEQSQAERNLTSNSDVFALGVVLQEALAGYHPTARDQNRLYRDPPLTEDLVPHAPTELAVLIDQMLGGRPAFRPRVNDLVHRFGLLAETL